VADLPVELISRIHVKLFFKNISLYQKQNHAHGCAVPPPSEGRIAIVTDVGSGMRWTCWRAIDEARERGRPSRVVPTPRRWCQPPGHEPGGMVA